MSKISIFSYLIVLLLSIFGNNYANEFEDYVKLKGETVLSIYNLIQKENTTHLDPTIKYTSLKNKLFEVKQKLNVYFDIQNLNEKKTIELINQTISLVKRDIKRYKNYQLHFNETIIKNDYISILCIDHLSNDNIVKGINSMEFIYHNVLNIENKDSILYLITINAGVRREKITI